MTAFRPLTMLLPRLTSRNERGFGLREGVATPGLVTGPLIPSAPWTPPWSGSTGYVTRRAPSASCPVVGGLRVPICPASSSNFNGIERVERLDSGSLGESP